MNYNQQKRESELIDMVDLPILPQSFNDNSNMENNNDDMDFIMNEPGKQHILRAFSIDAPKDVNAVDVDDGGSADVNAVDDDLYGQCTDCDEQKIGKIHDADGSFYCSDCWNNYDDVIEKQKSAILGGQTSE